MDLFDVLMTECISAPSSSPVDEFEGMSSLEPSPVVGDLNLKNLQIHYKWLRYCFFSFFFSHVEVIWTIPLISGLTGEKQTPPRVFFFIYTKVKLGFFIRTGFDFTEKQTFLLSSFQNKQRVIYSFALKCTSAICRHSTEPSVKLVFLCCIITDYFCIFTSCVCGVSCCHGRNISYCSVMIFQTVPMDLISSDLSWT